MAHTQFLDESDFSLKIGGIEINPQTGDGIEGILKFDSWKVKKDSEDLVFYYTDVEKFRISNVDGAIKCGIHGIQFVSPENLIIALKKYGIKI